MELISNARQAMEFFSVKGEAIVQPETARPKRPPWLLTLNNDNNGNQSSSPEKDEDEEEEEEEEEEPLRERKRMKYVHDDGGEHETQSLSSSSFRDQQEICDFISLSAKARARHHEGQNQNQADLQQKRSRKGGVKEAEGSSGLQLVCLLLNCASAIAENKKLLAANLLSQLYSRVTLTGNSIERVAAHFAQALKAKLSSSSTNVDAKQSDEESQKFAALLDFYRVSPLYQFAHLTANQAIIEAFEGQNHLHIVDFDISHGIQWSSLIQSLSERKDLPSLRITGFGRDENLLRATGIRLSNFAESFGFSSFEFHPVVEGSKQISAESLQIREEETVAVNLVLYLNRVASSHNVLYSRLRSVQVLKPAIVALVEHEASHSPTTFLSRFMESLHYYAALFDSLDECLPLQSAERLRIERFHFGEQIKSSIREDAVDERGRRETHERWETWRARMEKAGFGQIGLSSHCVSQAKLLLQARAPSNSFEGGGFRIDEQRERGRVLSLAWEDRLLISASAWRCKI